MQISQIYLSSQKTTALPIKLRETTSSIEKLFPDETHIIYDNEMLRDFIAEKYSREVVLAYDSLVPYAYKADLGRYCLLYELGGWYFDIAVRLIMQPKVSQEIEWISFRDPNKWTNCSWSCSNAAIYSTQKNNILQTAIEMIIRNCKTGYYGIRSIDPTGPSLLGQALAANGTNNKHIIGDILALTPSHKITNRAFVLPNGSILAWSKPWLSGGPVSLNSLGAEGTNDYKELWAKRSIYQPDIIWE
jgi:mannosyltransferase OCH1-like enzyme